MSLKLNERYPGRFNNPSAGYPQGSYKNRTTPVAKDGSYLERDWANDKEGFFQSLLAAVGVEANGSVDQVGASQNFDAMLQLQQAQIGQAFTTGGTGTALTLTPAPAISAYASSQRFSVKFSVSSGASPTLNVSAKGAKSLKQYDSTGAKVAAVFVANQLADVEYDGTDWIVLNPLAPDNSVQATETISGILKVATQTQVNNGADDATAVTPKKLASYIRANTGLVGVSGKAKNLKISTSGTDALALITADELIVRNGDRYRTIANVGRHASFGIAGAGGLDIGAANSQTASTWYAIWIIQSAIDVSALLSLSATAPALPSGYTYGAFVGWVKTASASPFYPVRLFQNGTEAEISSVTTLASGSTSSVVTAVSLAGSIPPGASKVKVSIFTPGDANAKAFVMPSTGYSVYDYCGGSGPAISGYFLTIIPVEIVLQSTSIAWSSAGPNSKLNLLGWSINL